MMGPAEKPTDYTSLPVVEFKRHDNISFGRATVAAILFLSENSPRIRSIQTVFRA